MTPLDSTQTPTPKRYKRQIAKGERFGKLVYVRDLPFQKYPSGYTRRKAIFLCDCGKEKALSVLDVTACGTRSCGCARWAKIVEMHKGNMLEDAAFNLCLGRYIRCARKRGLEFSLTRDEFRDITSQNCTYCGKEPSHITWNKPKTNRYMHNGIDRADNLKGYTPTNCVPCCSLCNRMKMAESADVFLAQVHRIHAHSLTVHGGATC